MIKNYVFWDETITEIILLALLVRIKLKRSSVPKVIGFAENIVPKYINTDFRSDFRLNFSTFESLLEKIQYLVAYEERPSAKPALTPNKQLLVYIWYIANQDSMREVARLFGISKSTVHRTVRHVSEAICQVKEFIRWPSPTEQLVTMESIEEVSHIKGCVGFIDGTHVRLAKKPDNDYINRKGFPSLQLQLIVDDSLKILDTYCGWPGCTHDARVYRNSPIANALSRDTGELLAPDAFIIGDSAYPLSEYLITPFKDTGRLTKAEKFFNRRASSVRQSVERTIGHLKGRFRRLRDLDCKSVEDACFIITSACALHNLCILSSDPIEEYLETTEQDVNNYPAVYRNETSGIGKRARIVEYLKQFS